MIYNSVKNNVQFTETTLLMGNSNKKMRFSNG